MILVISSPSSSTTGLATLIFAIRKKPFRCAVEGMRACAALSTAFSAGLESGCFARPFSLPPAVLYRGGAPDAWRRNRHKQDMGRFGGPNRRSGRAAARREYRHGGARHGEFRPVR